MICWSWILGWLLAVCGGVLQRWEALIESASDLPIASGSRCQV